MITVYNLSKMDREILSALLLLAMGEGDNYRYEKNALMEVLGLKTWGHYRNEVMRRLEYAGLVDIEVMKKKGRYTYYWGITYTGQSEIEKHLALSTKGAKTYKTMSAIDMSGAR